MSPFYLFAILGGAIAIGVMAACVRYLRFSWLLGYLCGINVATFLFYFYDKKSAKWEGKLLRVPEAILHLFAFFGGTPIAIVCRPLFHHKTVKLSFRIVFWSVAAAQLVVLWHIWPWLL